VAAARYVELAKASSKNGDSASVVTNYEKAMVRAPNDIVLLRRAGRACYERGQYDAAERFFRRALQIEYFDNDAVKWLAFTLHAGSKLDDAVYYYFRYLDMVRDDYDALVNLGALFLSSGQYEQAIEYSRRAALADRTKAAPLHNVAVANFNLGRFDEAEASIREALSRDHNADSLRLLGLIQETQARTTDALQSYKEACELKPEYNEACLDLARLYNRLDLIDEYLESANRAVLGFERDRDQEGLKRAYWDLGWAYYRSRQWENSAEASRKALQLEPRNAPPRFNLGLALLLLGRAEEAMREYTEGVRHSKVSDLKKDAIEDLEEALRTQPDLVGAGPIIDMLATEYSKVERQWPARSKSFSRGHS